MADQVPEAWIGQEVAVNFGGESAHVGILESVDERGILVRTAVEDGEDYVAWYPMTSVGRLAAVRQEGQRRQARTWGA